MSARLPARPKRRPSRPRPRLQRLSTFLRSLSFFLRTLNQDPRWVFLATEVYSGNVASKRHFCLIRERSRRSFVLATPPSPKLRDSLQRRLLLQNPNARNRLTAANAL